MNERAQGGQMVHTRSNKTRTHSKPTVAKAEGPGVNELAKLLGVSRLTAYSYIRLAIIWRELGREPKEAT
jgi:hypothetical protein